MMTACVLDNFQAAASVGSGRACLALDPAELIAFIRRGFEPMNRMFDRSGAGEAEIRNRTYEILDYYGLHPKSE